MLKNTGGHACVNTKGKPGSYHIKLYPGSKQPITIVLKWENQVLPMGICNSLDILRQDIQNLPGIFEAMHVTVDVRVLTTQKLKINLKALDKVL